MRRRINMIGAALSAGVLVFGAAAAAAKPKHAGKHNKGATGGLSFKPVAKTTCKITTGITVAAGEFEVIPPVPQGVEFGSAVCGKKVFGKGVQKDIFTVPDSGENKATYQMYFPTGTIHGKYVLTPQEGNFTPTTFTEIDYVGKLMITGGTGAYKGAKGIGTMTCQTLDAIHTVCTDKLKFKQL